MRLWSDSLKDGQRIPEKYALGRFHPAKHVELCDNRSPHLAWADLPAGTRSLAVIVHDRDVPSRGDDVNKEGRVVPAALPRVDFFHWVLVDLAPDVKALAEGEWSSGVTAHGKPGPAGPHGTRQGLNDYTGWFAGDAGMAGQYFGYDGPCPPWNDSIVHHYPFSLYALDIARCPVEGAFTGNDARAAIRGHVLGEASLVVTYSIYPDAR
jgi:Raf kinase inhibitor-like YbhB/YbcL family protein